MIAADDRPEVEVPCGRCGATLTLALAASANASRDPAIAEAIRAGTFHVATCACGGRVVVETEVLYTDLDRGWFIGVFPRAAAAEAVARERDVEAAFVDAIGANAPPAVLGWAGTVRRRVVFGYDALREKVLCADLGLDDRLLEAWKGAWLVLTRASGAAVADLRLVGVAQDRLVLIGFAEGDRPVTRLEIPIDEVRALRGRPEPVRTQPWLFDRLWVHHAAGVGT